MFSHQTRIAIDTITFKPQSLILNQFLRNTLRSDHLITGFHMSMYFSLRQVWDFEPPRFIFYLNVFPLDSNYSIETSNWFSNSNCLRRFERTGAKYLSTPPIFW